MPKCQISKALLTGTVLTAFSLIWLAAPCFSESSMLTPGRVFLAEEKGFLERTKDAVKKKTLDIVIEKKKRDAQKKLEDSVKAAKKKLDDLKK